MNRGSLRIRPGPGGNADQHHRPFREHWLAALGGALLWAVGGCGDTGEKFFPVAGKVTLANKPLPVGAVSFRPDAARGNHSKHIPTGAITAAGEYELITIQRKGAPAGWYKVLVFADANSLKPGTSAHPLPPVWLMNIKYTEEKTTDLFVEVVEHPGPGSYDLRLSK
jgi:hypothetical protein